MGCLLEEILQSQKRSDTFIQRVLVENTPRNGMQLIVQGGFHGNLFSLTWRLCANAPN